jgi:hypothetical protein
MKLGKFFGHLVESLYTIGAVVVGGAVGALAIGIQAAAHGVCSAYMWYEKAKESAYKHGLNTLLLEFIPPYGAIVSSLGHLSGAYSAVKEK